MKKLRKRCYAGIFSLRSLLLAIFWVILVISAKAGDVYRDTIIIKDTTIYTGEVIGNIRVSPITAISPSNGQYARLYNGQYGPPIVGCGITNNFSANNNYIVNVVPRKAGYVPNSSICGVMQTVRYLDGLGRPLQSIQVRGSADSSKDVVQPFAYDQYGREAVKILPYAAASVNGNYRPDALITGTGVFNYYKPAGVGADGTQQINGVVINTYPYSQTGFEPSPLDRPLEQGAPGAPWQLSTSGVSGAGHTMKMSYGTNANGEVTMWVVNSNGNGANGSTSYSSGQLYKTATADENGNQTIEFKDKEGRVVCKKVQANNSATVFYSTNYVYNDLGQLSYVIPEIPTGVPTSFTEDTTDVNFKGFIYAYHYDERSRLAEKKIPGRGWECVVYNALDQLVATQDANQRLHNWYTFTKYDGIGRVIMTGRITDSRSHQTITTAIASQTQSWETPVTTGDGYTTTHSFPNTWDQLYTVNYYDNYTFPGGNTYASTATGVSYATTGLITGSKTNILGTTTMLLTEMYYDDKGRMLESIAQNHIGGYDRMVNTYNFNDQVTQITRTHNSNTVSGLSIVTAYAYDHMGRKTTTKEKIGAGNWVTLNQLDYNDIGQLKTKHLGNDFQQVAYAYNERGWMVKDSAQRFAMQLKYNTGNNPQYNGNISQMNYAGATSGTKAFNYTYDNLNRLMNAQSTNSALDEQLTYDPLGNIKTLTRAGQSYGTLNYTYENNDQSNRLSTVTGTGFNRSYAYDANGNATSDGGSKSIKYNYLNLPDSVGNSATYTYDAAGKKLTNAGSDGKWDHVDGIVYKNNNIVFIQTEEGRAIPGSGSYAYQYDLKDHLGDTRVSIDQGANVLQEDEYYSFGLRKNVVDNNNGNRYLYNGKEIQTDLTNQYDYGARFYDPVIGRWTTIDPKAEFGRRWTPYTYGFDNPIRFVDPDGMWPEWGEVGMFLGSVAQSVQRGWDGVKALMKQTPMETASALNKGLKNESIKNALVKAIVKNTVKFATGGHLDKAAVLGTVTGEALQLGLPEGDIAKAGDVARMGELEGAVGRTAGDLKAAGSYPATVGGAELNGQTAIATSGAPPTVVAPQMEEAAKSLGGIGAKTSAGTVGACCEVHAANELLLKNPTAMPRDINLTPAIRPRTGQVVPMCDNCKVIFNKQK